MVSELISCVEVIKTVVPSGTPVFRGSVIVPVASVPAGCNNIHCCSLTGVGTVMLNPVPGTYRFVDKVGDANVCWKYCRSWVIDTRRASPLLGT